MYVLIEYFGEVIEEVWVPVVPLPQLLQHLVRSLAHLNIRSKLKKTSFWLFFCIIILAVIKYIQKKTFSVAILNY